MNEEQVPAGKAPTKSKVKTPNIRALESMMNEQNDAVAERLDQMEETANQTAENMSEMLEAMKAMTAGMSGMSAKNRPHGGSGMLEAEELMVEHDVFREFGPEGDFGEIEVQAKSLDQMGMAKLDALAFDQELLDVRISEAQDEAQDKRISVAVNGKEYVMWRGMTYRNVPRFIVEGLARAKPYTFSNVEYTKPDGSLSVKWPAHMGLRYPFQVVRDNNPKGADWLQGILSQRH